MFYCQITGKLSKPGQKPERITVSTRPRTYTKWVRNEETNKWEEVFVATGWEIVKEVNASEEGAAMWKTWTPEEKAAYAQGA